MVQVPAVISTLALGAVGIQRHGIVEWRLAGTDYAITDRRDELREQLVRRPAKFETVGAHNDLQRRIVERHPSTLEPVWAPWRNWVQGVAPA